ncbi:hypothetical protein KBB12_01740 [Candidatus Woesebacteria bacterium]|nr:hypothetical protein [Candidatus Woesebacteria bacterium]
MKYLPDITLENTHQNLLGVASTTGVYVYKQQGAPIYIGKAVNLKARLLSHEQNALQNAKEDKIVSGADTIDLIYTDSEFLALVLEARLISSIKPKYNVRWRDDKSHLYIKITIKDTYPKVYMTRREDDGESRYFGPFDSVRSVETLLKQLRRVVPFCTQKNVRKGSCFYHKIGLCDPCPNLIDQEAEPRITELQKKYRAQIRLLIRILEGKTDIVFRTLRKNIVALTQENQYEEAIKVRDASKQLELLIMYGGFVDGNIHAYNQSEQATVALKTILKPFFPTLNELHRIECYDNSTLGFQHSTASMVVFTDGMVDKKEYRKFRLKTNPNNDFDMMKEVVSRRVENSRWESPDLIVLDGGKPQVRAVMDILNVQESTSDKRKRFRAIPLIGLAKNPDRIIVGVDGLPTLRPPRHDLGYRLLQLLRDEAHRFSKKYHTYLRTKAEMVQ